MKIVSRDLTFHPGDIVDGGTGAGTAQDSCNLVGDGVLPPEKVLKPGDRVDVPSLQITVLGGTIVAAG